MKKTARNKSLDAMRGLAILAMVFSSSIAFGILPAWMYHAQEPPPAHEFIPTLAGISWVDLVFPFFLFSMGAAIPLALNKKIKEQAGFPSILFLALRRYVLLVFFAIFTVHARSAVMSHHPSAVHYLLSIVAFVLLFFQLYKPSASQNQKLFTAIKVFAFVAAGIMLYFLPSADGKGFSLYRSDIIIIILANMAFFGTLIWWFTRKNQWLRLCILPFIMAILVGAKEPSWNESLFRWSPLPWMYQFYYLKYLFVIIPGTLAGDWLLTDPATRPIPDQPTGNKRIRLIAFLSFVLIVTNVILLFGRYMLINLFVTVTLCTILYFCIRQTGSLAAFFKAGAYLLLLGLFFEAYEGGIKKDPSTFSYYFVTSGLAFFLLIALHGLQSTNVGSLIVHYLGLNGMNPMVAYVTGNLLLLPALHLTGGITLYDNMQKDIVPGFLSGVLFTGVVSVITVIFTKRRWIWRT